MLEAPGKVGRYNDWLKQVDAWAKQHGITLEQAMSILCENRFPKNITIKEILSWIECDDFIFKWKEQHDE
jgi:hypothetical protein